jgi:hypothetical protein
MSISASSLTSTGSVAPHIQERLAAELPGAKKLAADIAENYNFGDSSPSTHATQPPASETTAESTKTASPVSGRPVKDLCDLPAAKEQELYNVLSLINAGDPTPISTCTPSEQLGPGPKAPGQINAEAFSAPNSDAVLDMLTTNDVAAFREDIKDDPAVEHHVTPSGMKYISRESLLGPEKYVTVVNNRYVVYLKPNMGDAANFQEYPKKLTNLRQAVNDHFSEVVELDFSQ